jgi:hypothetical protein
MCNNTTFKYYQKWYLYPGTGTDNHKDYKRNKNPRSDTPLLTADTRRLSSPLFSLLIWCPNGSFSRTLLSWPPLPVLGVLSNGRRQTVRRLGPPLSVTLRSLTLRPRA